MTARLQRGAALVIATVCAAVIHAAFALRGDR